jgi:hypothetical protein
VADTTGEAPTDVDDATPEDGESRGSSLYAWDAAIPLVTNPFMLWDLLKLWSISGMALLLVIAVLQLADPGPRPFSVVLVIPVAVSLGLFALSLVVCLVFLLNRFFARFDLRTDGVQFQTVRWTRKLSRAVSIGNLALGVLALRPQAIGAGLLADVQRDLFLPWGEIRKVTVFPRLHTLTLSNSWRPVLRLHCSTGQVFETALAVVREQVVGHGGTLSRRG